MIETLIFIAVVIIAAIIICWAIRAIAGAFAPAGKPTEQVVTVLIVLVVLIALLVVLQHLGYGKL